MAGLLLTALGLCLFIPAGESQVFTIHVEHSRIHVAVREHAFISVRPSAEITGGSWAFGGVTVARWIADTVSYGNGYSSRAELFTSNGSLLLQSVNASDSGEYLVTMIAKGGSPASANITLRVFFGSDRSPGGLSAGATAGIVVGVFAGVAIVGALAAWLIKRNSSRMKVPEIHHRSIKPGVNNTLATDVADSSQIYENMPRHQKSTAHPPNENSIYMGLILEDQSVYSELRRYERRTFDK
ncbi:carcinoembryonic antigen-related cell adhesion molecule 1-like [Pristis pectinata]|uniref:carcinoembryonic antigen-related cell adhesion molecule 1-like n=1 Tax=Pristis pectinata TaxID=685728 RepID=UPI00223E2A69|nr:carcinoembryonic antigen-related cell adhesion molecule 1-like [Pristis pectinata]